MNRVRTTTFILSSYFFTTSIFAQTFQGVIQVLITDDFKHSKSHLIYQLKEGSKKYKLHISPLFKKVSIKTGDEVTIEGTLKNTVSNLEEIQVEAIYINKSLRVKKDFLSQPNIITFLVNFLDKKSTNNNSVSAVDTMLFTPPTFHKGFL